MRFYDEEQLAVEKRSLIGQFGRDFTLKSSSDGESASESNKEEKWAKVFLPIAKSTRNPHDQGKQANRFLSI
jgi:hypothetical protein